MAVTLGAAQANGRPIFLYAVGQRMVNRQL